MSGSRVSHHCSVTPFHQETISSPDNSDLFVVHTSYYQLTNVYICINVKIDIRMHDVQFSSLPQSVMASPKEMSHLPI